MTKIKFDFDMIEDELRSKILKGSVIPRPIAWISTLNETGTVNLAPFSYFNVVSSSMMVVSFQRMASSQKDTFVNIMRDKEAVVHIVDQSLLEIMDETGRFLEKNDSEFEKTDLTLTQSLKVKTPALKEALVSFEVVLSEAIELSSYDGSDVEADLLILRVLASTVSEEVYDKEKEYIKGDKLDPVSRLGGADYGSVNRLPFKRKF